MEYTEYIKVNLPDTLEAYEHGNGEGVWCLVDAETKRAHDENMTGGGYVALLDNDSWYWRGLMHGAELPIELRGDYSPVDPFEWLAANYRPCVFIMEDAPIYCPFCGNDNPEVFSDGETWGVYCDFCNAEIRGYVSSAAAVKQWNHRYRPEDGEQ